MENPQSLLDAVRYFADVETCNRYMRRIKWRGGKPVCPHCDGRRIGEISTRKAPHLLPALRQMVAEYHATPRPSLANLIGGLISAAEKMGQCQRMPERYADGRTTFPAEDKQP